MRIHRWGRRRLLPIAVIIGFIFTAVFLFFTPPEEPRIHFPPCPLEGKKYLTVDKLLLNDDHYGGLGNRLFEMASFVMLAVQMERTPIIRFEGTAGFRRRILLDFFPNLDDKFAKCEIADEEAPQRAVADFSKLPFIDVPARLDAAAPEWRERRVIRFKDVLLLQSYRYFYGRRAELLRLLSFPQQVIAAADRLMPAGRRDNDINVCVHVRRGDFLYSELHQHSTANFTLYATRAITKRVGRLDASLRLFVFGDDQSWSQRVFEQHSLSMLDYPVEFIAAQPMEEWAFSSRHCDAVLLTAPLSTFGWWLAFFSQHQSRVFYSSRFTKENQSEECFVKDDFIPPDWQMLENNDDSVADVPLSLRITPLTWAIAEANYFLRKHFSVHYRF